MTGAPYSHCSYCGTVYPDSAGWPRACAACGQLVWRNPLPVAVALLPVRTDDGPGVVVQRRDIDPGRGLLSLPGGFIEYGEDWRDALVRELREETNLLADSATVRLYTVLSPPYGGSLLIFGELPEVSFDDLPPSRPTPESTEWLVLTEPTELAFSTHTEVLADFLARHQS